RPLSDTGAGCMTPLDVVWVAVLAFGAGAAVGYRLARAVMVRFVADAVKAIERPTPAAAYEPPTVIRQATDADHVGYVKNRWTGQAADETRQRRAATQALFGTPHRRLPPA